MKGKEQSAGTEKALIPQAQIRNLDTVFSRMDDKVPDRCDCCSEIMDNDSIGAETEKGVWCIKCLEAGGM